jgi:hypothetical protein
MTHPPLHQNSDSVRCAAIRGTWTRIGYLSRPGVQKPFAYNAGGQLWLRACREMQIPNSGTERTNT